MEREGWGREPSQSEDAALHIQKPIVPLSKGGWKGKARAKDPPFQGLQHSISETNLPGQSRALDVLYILEPAPKHPPQQPAASWGFWPALSAAPGVCSWEPWLFAAESCWANKTPPTQPSTTHGPRSMVNRGWGLEGEGWGRVPSPSGGAALHVKKPIVPLLKGGWKGKARAEDPPFQRLQHSNSETNLPGQSRALDVL